MFALPRALDVRLVRLSHFVPIRTKPNPKGSGSGFVPGSIVIAPEIGTEETKIVSLPAKQYTYVMHGHRIRLTVRL